MGRSGVFTPETGARFGDREGFFVVAGQSPEDDNRTSGALGAVVTADAPIGRRRFAEGLERYRATGGTRPVEVEYRSFELAPDTPVDFAGSEVDFPVELTDHRDADAMRADIEQAHEFNICGVPCFGFDGQLGVSGAADPSTFAQSLNEVGAGAG